MFDYRLRTYCNVMLSSIAALSVAACGSSGSYRVASIGSVPGDTGATGGTGSNGSDGTNGSNGSNGGSGSNGSNGSNGSGGSNGSNGSNGGTGTSTTIPVVGKVLVTAGNTVIGVSGTHNALATKINGLAPGTTQITGTVTNVLRKTGQSLVDLGQGQSLILNGSGGKLGEIVKIDLLSKTVVGATAGSRLLGVSVLSPTVATGSVAAVNLGNGGSLVTLGNGPSGTPTPQALTPVTNVVNGLVQPKTNVVTGVVGNVTGLLAPK